jgi:hypothetical protein
MRTTTFVAFAAALVLGFSFASCNCGTDPNPPGGTGGGSDGGGDSGEQDLPDSGTCVGAGVPCEATRPCCSGTCNGSVCTTSTFCKGSGGSCTANTDCCLNNCSNGSCGSTACINTGGACNGNSDCCTQICNGTCQALPTTGGNTCKVLGEACGARSECCSTNCQGGVCVRAYYCQANGDVCTAGSQCCGGVCSSDGGTAGRCLNITGGGGGGCTQEGNPCSGNTVADGGFATGGGCCSRICFDPGSGAPVCLPAGGCRLTGTFCNSNQSCCGGGTNPNGSVVCQGAPAGRCDNGTACNPVGNICGAPQSLPDGGTFKINASQDCCDGKKEVCKSDSSGIPRCFGGGSTTCPTGFTGQAGCCIATGSECQFKDQCCGGAPCLPGSDGKLRCGTTVTCVAVGSACGGDAGTCCTGTQCTGAELGTQVCQNIPTGTGGGGGATGGGSGGSGGGTGGSGGGTGGGRAHCQVTG